MTAHERQQAGQAPHTRLPRALGAMAEAALEALVTVLEERADLRERLQRLIGLEQQSVAPGAAPFMSIAEYARHRRVSERTIRAAVLQMTAGVHYERSGQRGRRVIIRVAEADAWQHEHQGQVRRRGIEDLAVDEVTRLRARVALRKRKVER